MQRSNPVGPRPALSSVADAGLARSGGFHRLLVCLDRSSNAEAVLPLTAHLAAVDEAAVTLVHVVEPLRESGEIHAADALEWEIVRQDARRYLDEVAGRIAAHGVAADSRIAVGGAAHAVTTLAAEIEADLLVLSTIGESGPNAWSLGSTARKLLDLARCAVLVVPGGGHGIAAHVPLRRILVPLDGSLRGESVLPAAVRLARADDAEIVLAHAVAEPIRTEVLCADDDLALARTLADRLTARAEHYLDRIRAQLEVAGVRARTLVRRAADHREGIVLLAAGEQVDLVVVSAHGCGCNPRRAFGSVTGYLLGRSPVAVLVLHDVTAGPCGAAVPAPARMPSRAIDAPERAA
jgi:nucleotide-binding universal stress UspA family protein